GFAFDIDLLMKGIPEAFFHGKPQIDVGIYYDIPKQKESFDTAKILRKHGFTVVTYPEKEKQHIRVDVHATLDIKNDDLVVSIKNEKIDCSTIDDAISILKNKER